MEAARKYQKQSTLRKVDLAKVIVKKKRNISSVVFPIEYSRYGVGRITHPIIEDSVPEIELCCAKFGCGIILSLREKIFGKFCIHHQNN